MYVKTDQGRFGIDLRHRRGKAAYIVTDASTGRIVAASPYRYTIEDCAVMAGVRCVLDHDKEWTNGTRR